MPRCLNAGMTEYQFHWWPSKTEHIPIPSVQLEAESRLHGAALALQQFARLGCDITAPLAHVDVTEPDGAKHTVLVEEVVDWLQDEHQAAFVDREGLGALVANRT